MQAGPSAFQPPSKEGTPPPRRVPAGQGAEAADSLPCLYSHNRITDGEVNRLLGSHKRTAHAICLNVQQMAERWGLECLAFLTLTFAQNVQSWREAMRRFYSLNANVLRQRYPQFIRIAERQKSGRWHFHLVVAVRGDVRTGIDFEAIERGDYRSAGPLLRSEWAFWRETAPAYGFGRTEMLPVRSTAEGIARYVGKYVSKHIGQREDRDRGARVVGYGNFKPGERRAHSTFTWLTPHSWEWRVKVAHFARGVRAETMADLQRLFGPRWAYNLQGVIMATAMEVALGQVPDKPVKLTYERKC